MYSNSKSNHNQIDQDQEGRHNSGSPSNDKPASSLAGVPAETEGVRSPVAKGASAVLEDKPMQQYLLSS